MATQIEKSTMKYYDKHGTEHKVYPKTTVDQVIGLEDTISELVEASDVTDTYGIAGTAGQKKKPQNMFDAIGNFIQNSAITVSNFVNKFKERLQNNLTTTEEGYALDARQGKELQTNISNVSTTVTSMGQTISSMQTSIEALEENAEHMIAAKIVLDKDEWSNNSQTITVEGMQEEDNMCIFICPFASSTEAFVSNNVICNIQDIDTLGFKCDTVPAVDIEVYLILKSATTEEDLSNLEIALTEAYQVIQRINSASSTAETNITTLNTSNNTATTNIASLQSQNQTAASRLSSLESANSTASTTISSLESQNQTATNNISALETASATATQNLSDLETANNTASSNLSSLGTANTTATSNISSLDTQNTNATSNITTLTGLNSTADQNISDINTATADGQTVLGNLSSMNTTASQTLSDLSTENDEAIANLNALNYDARLTDLESRALLKYANPSLTETDLITLTPGMYMYGTAYSWLPSGCNGYGTIISFLTNSSGYGVIQIFDTNGNVYSRHHNATGWHHGWQTLYKTPIHCLAQVNTGGDTTYTGAIVFNNVIQNYGNCYNTSTGVFTCPVNGIYAMSFGYYSNNTAANSRPAIMVNGSMVSMKNGPYGHDLSITRYCAAGDTITAGAYGANYPVYLYAGGGHNHFSVTLLQQIP